MNITKEIRRSKFARDEVMIYEIIDLPKIAIVGKEGFCTKKINAVRNLWEKVNLHFDDLADIARKTTRISSKKF